MENVKKCVGIIALKAERTQIYFVSDVLVAIALLDLKGPYFFPNVSNLQFLDKVRLNEGCCLERPFQIHSYFRFLSISPDSPPLIS